MEAHGGYSFCGLAALMFLNKGHLCNIDTLLKWAANRQMRVEGGFQVSTNCLTIQLEQTIIYQKKLLFSFFCAV